jgi:hypothetical protein
MSFGIAEKIKRKSPRYAPARVGGTMPLIVTKAAIIF